MNTPIKLEREEKAKLVQEDGQAPRSPALSRDSLTYNTLNLLDTFLHFRVSKSATFHTFPNSLALLGTSHLL